MSHVLKFVTDPKIQLMATPANNVNSKYGAEVIVGPHFNTELQVLGTCNLNAFTSGKLK